MSVHKFSAKPNVPAKKGKQNTGWHRIAVGEIEVTALYDGYVDFDRNSFENVPASKVEMLLSRMYINDSHIQAAGNNYLINTGDNLILVDTGSSDIFGDTLGWIPENIKASGYHPDEVDTVLMTHLHPDHVAGLLDSEKQPVYHNANVLIDERELEFWTSEDPEKGAPEAIREITQLVRQCIEPYLRSGRVKTFKAGEQVLPHVFSEPLDGHTPGHTGFRFVSGTEEFTMWGDALHNQALQLPDPNITVEFDWDPQAAVATRERIFLEAADTGRLVAAVHLPFPGIGRIQTDGSGYFWVPLEYGPVKRAAKVHFYKSKNS